MDKFKFYLDSVIDYVFLNRDEYKVVFYNGFLLRTIKFCYIVCFLLLFVFKGLVWCFNSLFGGLDLLASLLWFIIFVMLLLPVYFVIRYFVKNLNYKVGFRYKVEDDLRRFLIGNKFVDERLNYEPLVFFSVDEDFLIVRFRLDGHYVTKKFRELGEQLSSMFVLPFDSSEEVSGFVVYKFRLKEIERKDVSDIVNSGEVKFVKDSIVLNDDYVWNYRKCPHGLICGVTGSGKTFLFAYFIVIFVKIKAIFKIVDPKRADLFYLSKYFGEDVVYGKNHALRLLRESRELIDSRMLDIQSRSNYKWGEDYSYYNISPYFLIFDEVAVFASSLKGKDRQEYEDSLVKIIMEGRQAGVFLILAMQRPDIDFLPGSVRDQLGLRIALGNMSNVGYRMVFGDYSKDLKLENKSAGFYMDLKMDCPKEFFTPYLDIDFVGKIEEMIGYKDSVNLEKDS